MKKSWIGLAATGLVWLAAPGWVGGETPLASARITTPSPDKRAELLSASAREALAKGDAVIAIRDAEAATLILPGDAGNRALLGRAYLAAGRFASADTALGDALTLDPSQTRLAVTRALAQIALGQEEAALASLAKASGQAPEADIGLALALLGRTDEARERLMAAARAPGADSRARQNLAFAYALEGRWNDAATIAAQDVPADKMADRLHRWAMVAQLKNNPGMQVGALLGVLPATDEGQPLALALVAPRPAQDAPVLADAVTASAPPPFVVSSLPVVDAAPAAAMAEAAIESSPAVTPEAKAGTVAAIPAMLVAPAAPVAKPMMLAEREVAIPEMLKRPTAKKSYILAAKAALKAPRVRSEGKWAVQLGAFSSAHRTEAAWTKLRGRARFLTGYAPTGSGLRQANANLFRLSVSGLSSRAEATRLCLRIKAHGGACFVRGAAGERPMQWAMRNRPSQSA